MHGVAGAVLHARKVAVEFLGSNRFSHEVKQFAIVFRGTHLAVAACVNVGDVEDGNGSFNVVHDFKHLLKAAPKFLAA